jgi:hypothetical protein
MPGDFPEPRPTDSPCPARCCRTSCTSWRPTAAGPGLARRGRSGQRRPRHADGPRHRVRCEGTVTGLRLLSSDQRRAVEAGAVYQFAFGATLRPHYRRHLPATRTRPPHQARSLSRNRVRSRQGSAWLRLGGSLAVGPPGPAAHCGRATHLYLHARASVPQAERATPSRCRQCEVMKFFVRLGVDDA